MQNAYVVRPSSGFTLLELMVVVSIIAILALMMVPSQQGRVIQKQVAEALPLVDELKANATIFYKLHGSFPKNNEEAGLPEPDKLIGSFVKRVTLEDGAFHMELGNKVNKKVTGQLVTIRPMVVTDSPASPFSWVCGHAAIPEGMEGVGENKTSVHKNLLPIACRL